MPIVASEEFFQFCSGLHQDIFLLHGSEPQNWIRAALPFVPVENLPVLRNYLTALLEGPYSDAELQALYRSTYTEVGIREDHGVRVFFRMICDIIDEKRGA